MIDAHARRPGDGVGKRFQRQAGRRVADLESGQRVLRLGEETADRAVVVMVRTVGAKARIVRGFVVAVVSRMGRVIVTAMATGRLLTVAARGVRRPVFGMLNERVQTLAK